MFRLFFLFLLVLPLLEIYLFVRVGNLIGALPTVFLCILTAMLGTFLSRRQGLQTFQRVQDKIRRGEVPTIDLIEGFILLFSGFFLLIPGFFTDIVGLLCLIPRLRAGLAGMIIKRLQILQSSRAEQQVVIVEGECWEEQDKRLP